MNKTTKLFAFLLLAGVMLLLQAGCCRNHTCEPGPAKPCCAEPAAAEHACPPDCDKPCCKK